MERYLDFEEEILFEIQSNLPEWMKIEFNNHNNKYYDGSLTLRVNSNYCYEFIYDVKRNIRKEVLFKILNLNTIYCDGKPLLFLCDYMTPKLQEYCLYNKINFIDSVGNIALQHDQLIIIVTGIKNNKKQVNSDRMTLTLMKLIFILLSDEQSIEYNYRQLSALANISLGAVKNSFDYLLHHHFCRIDQNNRRRLMKRDQLIRVWLQNYGLLRSDMATKRFSGNLSWQDIQLHDNEFWVGEVEASVLTQGYLLPEKVQLVTQDKLFQRGRSLDLVPNDRGNIELISAFWGEIFIPSKMGIELLTVAELLISQDARNIEIVRKINEQYI